MRVICKSFTCGSRFSSTKFISDISTCYDVFVLFEIEVCMTYKAIYITLSDSWTLLMGLIKLVNYYTDVTCSTSNFEWKLQLRFLHYVSIFLSHCFCVVSCIPTVWIINTLRPQHRENERNGKYYACMSAATLTDLCCSFRPIQIFFKNHSILDFFRSNFTFWGGISKFN